MTKDELCWLVVNQHGKIDEHKILESSQLAVAMEHLGLIENEALKKYAAQRGGVLFCGNTNPPDSDLNIEIFSFRDLLELL